MPAATPPRASCVVMRLLLALATGDRILAAQPRRRQLHRLEDVLVTGAATQIARQPVLDLLNAGVGVGLQQLVGGHQEAGSAEAALQAVLVAVSLLDWM